MLKKKQLKGYAKTIAKLERLEKEIHNIEIEISGNVLAVAAIDRILSFVGLLMYNLKELLEIAGDET